MAHAKDAAQHATRPGTPSCWSSFPLSGSQVSTWTQHPTQTRINVTCSDQSTAHARPCTPSFWSAGFTQSSSRSAPSALGCSASGIRRLTSTCFCMHSSCAEHLPHSAAWTSTRQAYLVVNMLQEHLLTAQVRDVRPLLGKGFEPRICAIQQG